MPYRQAVQRAAMSVFVMSFAKVPFYLPRKGGQKDRFLQGKGEQVFPALPFPVCVFPR